MTHRNAVTYCDCVEFEGDAAGLSDSLFDNLRDFIKVNVARNDFAEAVGYPDERFIDVGVTQAAGVKQTAMRGSLKSFFYCVTFHFRVSPKYFKQSNQIVTSGR
jgi:hypothetical protein